MTVEIKICGLTRAEDARLAASLGAAYLGFIFAPSPRQLTLSRARALLEALDDIDAPAGGAKDGGSAVPTPRRPLRVGVFACMEATEVARWADRLGLDAIQLHDGTDAAHVRAFLGSSAARIWTVLHVGADGIAPEALERAMLGDAILLDAKWGGQLGGTGRTFDWHAVRDVVAPVRATHGVILAGGLRAENVAQAVRVLRPDVVDVSSGVEASTPGLKDPARMRAFVDAVHGVATA